MSTTIRLFLQDDVAAALELCRAAGWNQLPGDWSRLIGYQPQGCFVAQLDGKLVGTVTTTSYGKQLAWIGMMLVHPGHRRRGIATQLMQASLAYLRNAGVQCVKLDATPAGKPVYEKLGFQSEWPFHRWQLERPSLQQPQAPSQPIPLDTHARLDRDAFGADRLDWLTRLSGDSICIHHAGGFGMLRPGHLASYLGPVTANRSDAAAEMIDGLLSNAGGLVFWDVPHPNHDAVAIANRIGFRPVRDLTRMFVGELPPAMVELQYAMGDPGTG